MSEGMTSAGGRPGRVAVIVTTLPVEHDAVRKHLTDPRVEVHNAVARFERGTFPDANGPWTVVLASATHLFEVERAISVFSPNVVLFVGTAGGLRDVNLGDVAVADVVYDYDLREGRLEKYRRPIAARSPSYRLVELARSVARDNQWQRRIGSDKGERPNAVVKPFAAGSAIIADSSKVAGRIDEYYGDAVAVEMEGARIGAAYPEVSVDFLFIGGISDLLTAKIGASNRRRNAVAARHAAAFAFELLDRLVVDDPQSGSSMASTSTVAFEPQTSTLSVTIYLSDGANHEEVQVAVEALAGSAGLKIVDRDDPILRSWFRRMRARAEKSPVARDVAAVAAHALDSRLVLAQDATVTATLMQNLGPVLVSLQPTKDAVVRVGALLIVKRDWAVAIHQLTSAQQLQLDHQPQLHASPHEVLQQLGLTGPAGEVRPSGVPDAAIHASQDRFDPLMGTAAETRANHDDSHKLEIPPDSLAMQQTQHRSAHQQDRGTAFGEDHGGAVRDTHVANSSVPVSVVVDDEPHEWEHQFTAYAESGQGWTGGDSTYAVPLATGQRLWLFSDTRLSGDRWINNSIVVQDSDGTLRTVHGGTNAEPDAFVVPPNRIGEDGLTRWLWTSDAIALDHPDVPAADRRLWTFFQEFRSTKPDAEKGAWDFAWVRTVMAELSLPDLTLLSQTPVDDGTGVQWGAAVRRVGKELLVFGVVDEGTQKHLVMAKAQISTLTSGWLYRSADGGWSSQPDDAARLLTGVGNEFTVLPLPGTDAGWLLVTSDTTQPFGAWPIVAYWSADPTGPWCGPIPVHDPALEKDPPVGGDRYAYNPTLIQATDTSFVLAYNVNSTYTEVMSDRSIYRPRWRQVRISAQSAAAPSF